MPRVLLSVAVITALAWASDAVAFDIKNHLTISPFGGISVPLGAFADTDSSNVDARGAKTGFNFGAALEYGVSENIALGARFAYKRFDVDREVFGAEAPDTAAFDGEWTIVEMFGAYVKYVFAEGKATRPYARAGLFVGKPKAEIEFGDVDEEYRFHTSIGFDAGIGVTHMFSNRFGGFLEARFASLMISDSAPEVSSDLAAGINGVRDPGGNVYYLDITAGIAIDIVE